MEIFKYLPRELQEKVYLYIPDHHNFDKVMNELITLYNAKQENKKIFDKTIFKLQNSIGCWKCNVATPQKNRTQCRYCTSKIHARIFTHFMERIQ